MEFHLEIELNIHVFAEARWIIIAIGLRVTKSLQHGIAANQFIVHLFYLFFMAGSSCNKF